MKSEIKIIYRPFDKRDYKDLEEIIRKTWNYDRFCGPKTAQAMARLYLASCLSSQDFTCVAERDGRAVGVIMGKNEEKHHPKLGYRLRQLRATVSMLSRKDGRRTAKMFGGIDKLDRSLLENCGRKFKGELAFFAVAQNQRGTGIGKELFSRFSRFMKDEGIRSFYLFTDSTCNYGFYEHQGMKRIGKKIYSPEPYGKGEMEFYIYCG